MKVQWQVNCNGFPATFFLACFVALGLEGVALEEI